MIESPNPVDQSDAVALVAFLRSCLDEDERIARAAGWHRWELGIVYGTVIATSNRKTVARDCRGYDAHHIATFDPARVLADIESKRRLIDDVYPHVASHEAALDAEFRSFSDPPRAFGEEPSQRLLLALALPYRDRLGWRESWEPT